MTLLPDSFAYFPSSMPLGLRAIVLWFALGTFGFRHWEHLPLNEALLTAIYLREHRNVFWDLYSFWGQRVLFGIVISIFILQTLQRSNPMKVAACLPKKCRTT